MFGEVLVGAHQACGYIVKYSTYYGYQYTQFRMTVALAEGISGCKGDVMVDGFRIGCMLFLREMMKMKECMMECENKVVCKRQVVTFRHP